MGGLNSGRSARSGRAHLLRSCRCPYFLAIILLLLAGMVSVLSDGPIATPADQGVVAQAGADVPIDPPHPDLDDMLSFAPASPNSLGIPKHWGRVFTLWTGLVHRPGLRPPDPPLA